MQSMLCLCFITYVAAICLNYSGQDSKNKPKTNKIKNYFAVYNCDTHVTLKQNQGCQIWDELVDPKQGDNHAKFEKPHFNSVCKKTKNNVKGFVKS